jgi:opacity protein-like surface antigen
MKSKLTLRTIRTTPWAAATILGAVMVQAQVFGGTPLQPEGKDDPGERPPLLEVKVETSYTGNGEAKFRGEKYGDSDAINLNVRVSTLTPLSEKWFIPFELQSQNLELGSLAGLPVPDAINAFEFGTGLAYRPNDRWMFMARINAALYKLEDVGGNDIGISGGLMAMWEYSPSIKWTFGLMVQTDNDDLPVIPLIGVSWKINEHWELELMLLAPRLIYTANDKLKFYAGMGLNFGTTFRSSDTLGTSIGRSKFNDALGSYSDMRFGGGVEYRLSKSFSFEAEAGYATGREIKYEDIDEKVKFGDAPYVRVGLKYEF